MMRSFLWALVMVLGCCMLQPALLGQTHHHRLHRHARWQDRLKDLQEYEIVIPRRVDSYGRPMNTENHFLEIGSKSRSKRSSPSDENTPGVDSANCSGISNSHCGDKDAENSSSERNSFDENIKYYHVDAFGRTLKLILERNSEFLGGSSVLVEYRGANGSWVFDEDAHTHCFHTGHVVDEPRSRVAVSLCHSLMGAIVTESGYYMIEPHKENETDDQDSSQLRRAKPHVIYKSLQHAGEHCGVKDHYKHRRWKTSSDPWDTRQEMSPGEVAGFEQLHGSIIQSSASSSSSSPLPWLNSKSSMSSSWNESTSSSSSSTSSSHPRRRRSISTERYVEVMLVADSSVREYHGDIDLRHFLLTLMSIVASIYRDVSIGNRINIVVVRLLVLQDNEAVGLNVSTNAAKTLQNFCSWQQMQREPSSPNAPTPHSHDTAVLITRVNLCRSPTKCDTLGLAELGTMCDKPRSCSINEDSGLSSAFTIAHELGHVFNVPHDDNRVGCEDFPEQLEGRQYHIMAPTLQHDYQLWSWSQCSERRMTEFLDAGFGECLNSPPVVRKYMLSTVNMGQAGGAYSADQQCQLMFGHNFRKCPFMPVCNRLWCSRAREDSNEGCRTQHMPWADGTECASNKWCQKGKCIQKTRLIQVNGGWSSWGRYGNCSRTCGGGIKSASRRCDSPRPKHGGAYCVGARVRYKSCNIKDCEDSLADFRGKQCSKFNGQHFNIEGLDVDVQWEAMYTTISQEEECVLYCKVAGTMGFYKLAKKVIDGTKCSPERDDVCVNGKCMPAGCDNKLGSTKRRDRCGICGGDNSLCHQVTKEYKDPVTYGYNYVARIPRGASHFMIEQTNEHMRVQDDSYLALQNQYKEFVLNGDYIVSLSGKEFNVHGCLMQYSGSNTVTEFITCHNQIQEDLYVYVLTVGQLDQPNINYTYQIARNYRTTPIGFFWKETPWSEPCSQLCSGERERQLVCIRNDTLGPVDPQRCRHIPLPDKTLRQHCNTYCMLVWHVVEEGDCSSRCGRGRKVRKVKCLRDSLAPDHHPSKYVDDVHCLKIGNRPRDVVECMGTCEDATWSYGNWTQCSKTCGGGVKTRSAVCMDIETGQRLTDSVCQSIKMITEQPCNTEGCPVWVPDQWTQCSVTCGFGERNRTVSCQRDGRNVGKTQCDLDTQPERLQPCEAPHCPPQWQAGLWGQCSVTCGKGIKRRHVKCRSLSGDYLQDGDCGVDSKPELQSMCIQQSCPTTTTAPMTTSTTTAPTTTTTQPTTSTTTTTTLHLTTTTNTQTTVAQTTALIIVPTTKSVTTSPALTTSLTQQTVAAVPYTLKRYQIQSIPNQLPQLITMWRTGRWTVCSASCGYGTRERYVSCREWMTRTADERYCAHLPKPNTIEPCILRSCSGWRTGSWTPCSKTCGQGTKTRYVACTPLENVANESLEPAQCNSATMPEHQETCILRRCPPSKPERNRVESNDVLDYAQWRIGDWGRCTRTCDTGWQRRMVVCQGLLGRSTKCDRAAKPSEFRVCSNEPCPQWKYGGWGQCSQSCGGGIQQRMVLCQLPTGQTRPDDNCNRRDKPEERSGCGAHPCRDPPTSIPLTRARWHKSTWSQCSTSCGSGRKSRRVTCQLGNGTIVSDYKCNLQKPSIVKRCRHGRCPRWNAGKWSKCSATNCGEGQRSRRVRCIRNQSRVVDARYCYHLPKPNITEPCLAHKCKQYTWQTGKWSQCSVQCGRGTTMRNVSCYEQQTGNVVGDWHCDGQDEPRSNKDCLLELCQHIWRTSDWSQCSTSCGVGIQTRIVQCKQVLKEGILINTNQVVHGCNSTQPASSRNCNYGDCDADYHWETTEWNTCSSRCGFGGSERKIICVDSAGKHHSKKHCSRKYRPVKTKQCYAGPCYASSCRELKKKASVRVDGVYSLTVGPQLRQVYCSHMKKSNPKEYLTLFGNEKENYSEIYYKRLAMPTDCPANGTRIPQCRSCFAQGYYPKAGITRFHRVRLNLTDLSIITNDFDYSTSDGEKPVPFATAGDCYSATQNCPQGYFQVNLTGTGFKLSQDNQWNITGYKTVLNVTLSQDGLSAIGRCGGRCGTCFPAGENKLYLQLKL